MEQIDSDQRFQSILNIETGTFEMFPELKEERQARLRRERAARKVAAFTRKRMDEARTDALTKAWQAVYGGAEMPIHYDLVVESGEFKRTERCTLDATDNAAVFASRKGHGHLNTSHVLRITNSV